MKKCLVRKLGSSFFKFVGRKNQLISFGNYCFSSLRFLKEKVATADYSDTN